MVSGVRDRGWTTEKYCQSRLEVFLLGLELCLSRPKLACRVAYGMRLWRAFARGSKVERTELDDRKQKAPINRIASPRKYISSHLWVIYLAVIDRRVNMEGVLTSPAHAPPGKFYWQVAEHRRRLPTVSPFSS